MANTTKYNLNPLVILCVVKEERVSFADIMRYVQKTVDDRVDPQAVFSVVSKLVDCNILKINEDTTGTFSLRDWKMEG
jgi:hypothetical protein